VLLFSCVGLYDNENNYGCYDNLNSAFLLGKCWIANASSFRLLNSGITARTPNIFSVFLFDYNQQFRTNGLLKRSSGLTPTCTSHSDHLHYIISVYDATYCTIFFFLFSPTLFRLDRRLFFLDFSGPKSKYWALAASIFQRNKLLEFFFKFYIIQELSYYFIRKKCFSSNHGYECRYVLGFADVKRLNSLGCSSARAFGTRK